VMFTGDFLFVGDVGRPDLLGEEAKKELAHELYQSVFERITSLPDITEIFPPTGPGRSAARPSAPAAPRPSASSDCTTALSRRSRRSNGSMIS
jgi:glyoxylase-like metal-dependent hydrolase (beta-lactamase superfamily II)